MRRALAGAVVAVMGAIACGEPGSSVPIDAPVPDAVPIDAPPPGEPWFDDGVRRGRIELLELAGSTPRAAEAHANMAPQPTRMRFVFYARVAVRHWQQETMRVGSCRLLENVPAFCTSCDALCIAPEVCEPFPDYASAGALTFDGLRAPPLTLLPSPYFYASQGAQLAADAFADDAAITVTAAGADVPAFSITGRAVTPLATPVAPIAGDQLTLAGGADVMITWTPSGDPALRVRLALNANNMGHGQPYAAVIECDAADAGALTIPAALIDAFPPTERLEACEGSDCPLSTLTRYHRASADVDGAPIDLVVGSQLRFWLIRP